ncbi:hypothetical protein ACUNWD_03110 [Sunxiuqinia sp. A32]|uniref:hypothetical protein n=1 Tax=Sunxiuqinia sp. A32 TaxID=3461496 RepID=UPI004045358B
MKLRIVLMLLLILPIVYSCQEGDGDQDYGFAYIYMPQAMVSGGLDNYYNVPAGGAEYTQNFKVEDGKVKVILGVLHSGKLSDEAYSVDVNSSAPSSDVLSEVGGVVMPAIYSLPQSVSVSADQSGEAFYLSIDANELSTGNYDGQKLVLVVEISNPSNFELADVGTSVVVIVDVDSIKSHL